MNKKLIALALVLFIAVGGLFAELPAADPAIATLRGIIGDIFEHGFTTNGVKYQATANNGENGDAFTTDPVLTYGFNVKHGSTFKTVMTVTSFKKDGEANATHKVGIDKVVIAVAGATGTDTYATVADDTVMTVLKYSTANVLDTQEATITITPKAVVDTLPTATYISTLTITLASL